MKPIKLKLLVDAMDHYIYMGSLYIVLSDGGVVCVSLKEMTEYLYEKYPEYKNIIRLAFNRNDFWNSKSTECLLGFPTVKRALEKEWRKVADNVVFELKLEDLYFYKIINTIKSDPLHVSIYANKLLMGCRDGFYSIGLDFMGNNKLTKLFDAKTYNVSPKYGQAVLSLGKNGLVNTDVLNDQMVRDRDVKDWVSFNADWTKAGGIFNYSSLSSFQFISSEIERDKETPENYRIEKFALNSLEASKLYDKVNDFSIENSLISFNDANSQFMLLNNGEVCSTPLNVSKGKLSRPKIKTDSKFTKLKDSGRPLSGTIVAGLPVFEFDSQVFLLQDGKWLDLENDGIVSMHTYPRSTHFRDIVSITTDESINIHAIDTFNLPLSLFPSTMLR